MPCEQCGFLAQTASSTPPPPHSPRAIYDGADMGDAESTDGNSIHVNCNILTDEQFNMLLSYRATANRVSDDADSTRSTFSVPPLVFVDPGEDKPESLLEIFPLVSRETISEVIHFEFFHADLYKLDPTSSEASKEYPTLSSLIGPLSVYFQILSCYAASSNSPSAAFVIHRASLSYIAHLSYLNSIYEWSAVLQYHSSFFYRRSREMSRGKFSGWCSPDNELIGQVILGHNRTQSGAFKVSSLLVVVVILLQAWSVLPCKHFSYQ